MPFLKHIPFDVLPPILNKLSDRRDLYTAALVSHAFNRAATPALYASLDSRVTQTQQGCCVVHHPAETLVKRPEFAIHVREIQETGTVQGHVHSRLDGFLSLTLQALALCTRLQAFTWTDDHDLPDAILLSLLDVLERLPLRELAIRTHGNLGNAVWDKLHQFNELQSVSIWCFQGPPRILQGWSEGLSRTLAHLELGRCSGVPATILIAVLSYLRNLVHLRLKGAPSSAMPYIIAALPKLQSLDTDYNPSGANRPAYLPRMSPLKTLTVRTSSVDVTGPRELWTWITQLVPSCSLETFTLHSFSTMGEMSVPRRFILNLADVHGLVLKDFNVGLTQLTFSDIGCLCNMFPNLEVLTCSVTTPDARSIQEMTMHAQNLRSLRLNVQWVPVQGHGPTKGNTHYDGSHFTIEHAENMMRKGTRRLRNVSIGPVSFKGYWVPDTDSKSGVRFEISRIHLAEECAMPYAGTRISLPMTSGAESTPSRGI